MLAELKEDALRKISRLPFEFDIQYSVSATGDFSRDTRNNGVVILYAMKDNQGQHIYFSVGDPTDKLSAANYKKLSTLPVGLLPDLESYAGVLNVAAGNFLPGNENEMGISPDEIVVTYPVNTSGKISMGQGCLDRLLGGGRHRGLFPHPKFLQTVAGNLQLARGPCVLLGWGRAMWAVPTPTPGPAGCPATWCM